MLGLRLNGGDDTIIVYASNDVGKEWTAFVHEGIATSWGVGLQISYHVIVFGVSQVCV